MTNKLSKRTQSIREIVEVNKSYSFEEAVDLLQNKISKPKFVESIDVSVKLGIDPRKSDQVVRGATLLPKGSGKTVKIAVFTQGQNATAALEAGADKVGMDDLASEFQKGDIQYDVVIASPDAMGIVGRLGPLLGPRGLMPNPKVGTVTMNVAQAVKNAKAGQVRFRADKTGIIHCSIGKIDFSAADLKENLEALMVDLRKAKPSTSKGIYLQKISISSTMGPGLTVEMSSITF